MCQTCYIALGTPQEDIPAVRRLTAAAADPRSNRVNDLIQEWNIENVHLDGCLAWPHLPEREWIWITSMRRLSLAERGSVLALIAGYWRP
jgi:hypothetical protein